MAGCEGARVHWTGWKVGVLAAALRWYDASGGRCLLLLQLSAWETCGYLWRRQ